MTVTGMHFLYEGKPIDMMIRPLDLSFARCLFFLQVVLKDRTVTNGDTN